MNKKLKIWIAGGLAAAVAVFALGYVLVVKPRHNDVTSEQAQTAKLEQANTTLQAQIDQLLTQNKQITSKQIELARVANRIPADPGLPGLIRRLAQDARDSDVNLVSIAPTAPTVATPNVAGAAAYEQVGLTMEVHGTYSALHEWFTQLEDPNRRLIVVESLGLTEPKADSPAAAVVLGTDGLPESNNSLVATITARTFDTSPATITANLPAAAPLPAAPAASPSAAATSPSRASS